MENNEDSGGLLGASARTGSSVSAGKKGSPALLLVTLLSPWSGPGPALPPARAPARALARAAARALLPHPAAREAPAPPAAPAPAARLARRVLLDAGTTTGGAPAPSKLPSGTASHGGGVGVGGLGLETKTPKLVSHLGTQFANWGL